MWNNQLMQYLVINIIFGGIFSNAGMIDTRLKQHKGCSLCDRLIKESSPELLSEKSETESTSTLPPSSSCPCHQRANEIFPKDILKIKSHSFDSHGPYDSEEYFVKAVQTPIHDKYNEDGLGIFHLLNGIFLTAHSSARVDAKRAKLRQIAKG